MTVSVTTSVVSYTGNGSQTAFVGTFPMRDAAHLRVEVNGVSVSYAISGDISTTGWTATLATAPANGAEVVLSRHTPLVQSSDYTPYGAYQAAQLESDLDYLMLALQDNTGRRASDVEFLPSGTIASDNVQDALEEIDSELNAALTTKANASVQMLSGDANTLTITSPGLDNDVTFTPRVNIANGLTKLDGAGKVPAEQMPFDTFTYRGLWSVATNGSTPPAETTDGAYFVFSDAGNMTLRTSGNTSPHTVAVLTNDAMIYQANDQLNPAGWYHIARSQTPVAASLISVSPISGMAADDVQAALEEIEPQLGVATATNVSFTPAGNIAATNVQSAIQELDNELSRRFVDSGAQALIKRQDDTTVLQSTTTGGSLSRDTGAAVATWDSEGLKSAVSQSTATTALTRKDYVDGLIAGLATWVSSDITISSSTTGSANHSLGGTAWRVTAHLKCVDAGGDVGYANGDEVLLPITISTGTGAGFMVWVNSTQVGYTRSASVQIPNKSTASPTAISLSKWRLRVFVRKIAG